MTRRDFEKLLASAVLAEVLPRAASALAPPAPEEASAGPRFSVMVSTLEAATKLPYERCLEIIAAAGYRGVELNRQIPLWSPGDMRRQLARLDSLHLVVDAIGGVKSGFADPSGPSAMLTELQSKIAAARIFHCSRLILLSGPRADGLARDRQHQICIDNLKAVAAMLESTSASMPLTAVIEPIDLLENPRMYLNSVVEGFEIVRAVASPRVRLLYDFYHEARTAPDASLTAKLDGNIDLVGLVHIGDNPGRHQPGTGVIDYPAIYRKLGQLHYHHFIAMEFAPTGDPLQVLRAARLQAIEDLAQGQRSA